MAKTKKKATKKKAKKSASSSKSKLGQAKAMLVKALKGDDWHTKLDPKLLTKSIPHRPTGSIIVDYLIGGKANKNGIAPCPGLPMGSIFNLYGHEASGKTTLALTTAATTIKAGGVVCYIDWEHEIQPQYAAALGVPIDDEERFMLCSPDTLEDGLAILWTMASAGIELIVLDSVGAGVPKAYFEKSIAETGDRAQVGANAAAWSQFLPKLKARCRKTGTSIVAISQIRSAINTMGYGDNITVQGGKAFKFYSAVRMKLQKVGSEKASEYSALTNKSDQRVTGAKIKAKLDKCKVSDQQNNEEYFYIRWGEGIDDLRSIIEIAISHNVIRKKGAWLYWTDPDGEEHGKQGMEKFRGMFAKDQSKLALLQKQVRPFMATQVAESADEEEDEDFDPAMLEANAELAEIIGAMDD